MMICLNNCDRKAKILDLNQTALCPYCLLKPVCLNVQGNYCVNFIGLDKSGYQVNKFLFSQRKHMLWVLIRSASANEYPQHMFSSRNKKTTDTFWLKKAPYQEL